MFHISMDVKDAAKKIFDRYSPTFDLTWLEWFYKGCMRHDRAFARLYRIDKNTSALLRERIAAGDAARTWRKSTTD